MMVLIRGFLLSFQIINVNLSDGSVIKEGVVCLIFQHNSKEINL